MSLSAGHRPPRCCGSTAHTDAGGQAPGKGLITDSCPATPTSPLGQPFHLHPSFKTRVYMDGSLISWSTCDWANCGSQIWGGFTVNILDVFATVYHNQQSHIQYVRVESFLDLLLIANVNKVLPVALHTYLDIAHWFRWAEANNPHSSMEGILH